MSPWSYVDGLAPLVVLLVLGFALRRAMRMRPEPESEAPSPGSLAAERYAPPPKLGPAWYVRR